MLPTLESSHSLWTTPLRLVAATYGIPPLEH